MSSSVRWILRKWLSFKRFPVHPWCLPPPLSPVSVVTFHWAENQYNSLYYSRKTGNLRHENLCLCQKACGYIMRFKWTLVKRVMICVCVCVCVWKAAIKYKYSAWLLVSRCLFLLFPLDGGGCPRNNLQRAGGGRWEGCSFLSLGCW